VTVGATPNTVDSTATCAASPCPNLRSAAGIANANPGSTIILSAGTYQLTLGELALSASTTIIGSGAASTHIVQATPESRVIEVETAGAPAVTLEGLEIAGGTLVGSPADGGGVESLSAGTLTLRNVLVDRNETLGTAAAAVTGSVPGSEGGEGAGGGIYVQPGALVLDHVTVKENVVFGGEGGNAQNGTGGRGGIAQGGGVDVSGGALTMVSSTIAGNQAVGATAGEANNFGGEGGEADGAGVFDSSKPPTPPVLVDASTIANNEANGGGGGEAHSLGSSGGSGGTGRGAGLFLRNGIVENSTITNNRAFSGAAGVGLGFPGEIVPPSGGGVYVFAELPLIFASDTLYANVANPLTGGSGGNVSVNEGTSLTLRDTILAAGSAAPGTENCAGSATDGGHNLEDTTAAQCDLSAANGDIIGVSPLLAALAENGGPTETLALDPGSPALGAGGACTDPAKGGAPLTVDQRGLPRPAVCDIGAFQHQVPAGVVPGPHAPPAPPRPPLPTISGVQISHVVWREGPGTASLARRRKRTPVGTVISFALNTPAQVTVAFMRAASGRAVGRSCVPQTAHNRRRHHRCHREVTAGTLTFPGGHAGHDAITFLGSLGGGHRLPPGSYSFALAAQNASGQATAPGANFRIAKH
jgi:hypothetical protein